ncbi:MAG: HRDC domain-containing protein [Verrucomicrobia bacterium]|nr:HRDC domain-containing protein [Verrucomicrobiota bacterium]
MRDEIVVKGSDPYLLFVVEYLDGPSGEKTTKAPKMDYREELTEGEFAVFSALRDWRKAHSETEGVPVYTLFTNAQLAEIVKKKVGTIAELGKVEGVASRVSKSMAKPCWKSAGTTPPRKRSSGIGVADLECGGKRSTTPLLRVHRAGATEKRCRPLVATALQRVAK